MIADYGAYKVDDVLVSAVCPCGCRKRSVFIVLNSDIACTDYGYTCSYNRPVKKRGRTRLAARSAAAGVSSEKSSQEDTTGGIPSASTTSALSFLLDPVAANNNGESDGEHSTGTRETSRAGNGRRCDVCSDQMSQAISVRSPMSVWPTPPLSSIGQCRYPVLQPLLPYLGGILSVSTACDLFDVYLTDPGSSLFRFAPPYILTRIFRKKSLVHPTNPRPMSGALLASILWCCAQAAELPPLLAPGARSRIT
jgi:hypothetical protein